MQIKSRSNLILLGYIHFIRVELVIIDTAFGPVFQERAAFGRVPFGAQYPLL